MKGGLVVEVAEIIEETADIRSLCLRRLDGAPFTPFEAGAHIDVTGPSDIMRQYSLASDPRNPRTITISVKREPQSRGGSAALHQVAVGDHLKISRPRNLLAIIDDASHHVLIAGGIGVTPLLSMAYELWSRGASFELHYFARSAEEMAFRSFLLERADFGGVVRLYEGVSIEEQADLLTQAAARLPDTAHVYICGPVPFMNKVEGIVEPVVGLDHVHIEHFAAEQTATGDNRAFVVEVDGEEYEVPADKSILSVLEEHGIEIFKSCEEGICGSCVSGVLEGVPDHRDNCLSAGDKAAGTEIALCVSRASTDKLVIELY